MLLKSPKVSVIMPLYNKEADVERAMKSVLSQTFGDFEVIVVNDGSTDKSPLIVRAINDSRIRVIDQENAGVSAARNRGIQEARADLIAFLDADDEWMPTFLETILDLRERYPECKVFASNYLYREPNGNSRLPIIRGLPPHPWNGIIEDYFGVAAKSDPPLWTSAVAVSKDAIQSVGMFPVGVTSGEDLLVWAKLALNYDIAYSTNPLTIFCLRTATMGIPERLPDSNDLVGSSLNALLPNLETSKQCAFKKYIALWHRMRASQYLKMGYRSDALRETRKIFHFSNFNRYFLLYFTIAMLPSPASKYLYETLNLAKVIRRRCLRNKKILSESRNSR